MNKKSQKPDDALVVGVMCSIILAMLIWTAIMLHDVKKDVKHIGVQLDSMRGTLIEMLKPMEQLCKIPEGLEDYLKVDTDISAEGKSIVKNHHERENYSWELVQDMIEREVSSAFKLRTKPQQGARCQN